MAYQSTCITKACLTSSHYTRRSSTTPAHITTCERQFDIPVAEPDICTGENQKPWEVQGGTWLEEATPCLMAWRKAQSLWPPFISVMNNYRFLTSIMFGYAPKKMWRPVSYQSPSSSWIKGVEIEIEEVRRQDIQVSYQIKVRKYWLFDRCELSPEWAVENLIMTADVAKGVRFSQTLDISHTCMNGDPHRCVIPYMKLLYGIYIYKI